MIDNNIEKHIIYKNKIYKVCLYNTYGQDKIIIQTYFDNEQYWYTVYENNILESEYEYYKNADDLLIRIIKDNFKKYLKELDLIDNNNLKQIETLKQWNGVIK